jgi:glycosyltransferase involved in cell wall biosynthesis
MLTIGVFGDTYTAATGFATVLRNLSNELSRYFRVIYFGRFGQRDEFSHTATVPHDQIFEYVPTKGGVWDRSLVERIMKHYPIDIVFTEDDFYSVNGILSACVFNNVPFHFHTPIDSLPVHNYAFDKVFTYCDKIYIPNSSYKLFDGRDRLNFQMTVNIRERQGDKLKAVHLPHGVDAETFRYKKIDRDDEFTFMWLGRPEQRKNPLSILNAFKKIHKKMDARLFMRSDWTTPNGINLWEYIERKDLPITLDQMADIPHGGMADVYNQGDVHICTAMAGGFEMSTIEAAACQLPTLVTDAPYMNENVVDGKTGFKIPISGYVHPKEGNDLGKTRLWGNIDIDSLADRMYWCYLNQSDVRMMGRLARNYVIDNYNWRDIAYKLKEELKE